MHIPVQPKCKPGWFKPNTRHAPNTEGLTAEWSLNDFYRLGRRGLRLPSKTRGAEKRREAIKDLWIYLL